MKGTEISNMSSQPVGETGLMLLGALFQTLFPLNRKVERYLESATQDSVLDNLLQLLKPALKNHDARLSTIFRQFSNHDSDAKTECWNESSFRNYIRTSYDANILSNQALSLLWRSFLYFAYHPFPRGDAESIDEGAFKRGFALLALQKNDILGTQEGDWFWRRNDGFFHMQSWERMLRSVAVPVPLKMDDHSELGNGRESLVDDIIDTLSNTQPQPTLPNCPSEELLEPAANRLYNSSDLKYAYRAKRADVQILLEVLTRLRLGTTKWGWSYYFGTLNDSSAHGRELVEMMTDHCIAEQHERDEHCILTDRDVTNMRDLLPNTHLRFLQLWGMIFQPQEQSPGPPVEIKSRNVVPNSDILLGPLSLFIPQAATLARHEARLETQDPRIAFTETSPHSGIDSASLSITHLARALAKKENGNMHHMMQNHYTVLFTSSSTTADHQGSSSGPVLGVYFPGPLFLLSEVEGRPVYSTGLCSSSGCVLFQLWPRIQILKWAGDGIEIIKLLRSDAGATHGDKITELSLAQVAMRSPESQEQDLSEIPYVIGKPTSDPSTIEERPTGLYIDPDKRTVTLAINPRSAEFEKVGLPREASEITVMNAEMHIYTVSGQPIPTKWPTVRVPQDLSRYIRGEDAGSVAGEELKARIQGFGSN